MASRGLGAGGGGCWLVPLVMHLEASAVLNFLLIFFFQVGIFLHKFNKSLSIF